MTTDYPQCQQSASVAAMRACLVKHRKGLTTNEMRWFDEHFITALLGLLPDVRSMFGFGSGRGDFERFFFQSVRGCSLHMQGPCNASDGQVLRGLALAQQGPT